MYKGAITISTKRDKRQNAKVAGFTLIELLIVIAILAFLATIAVPQVKGIIDKAKDRITETNAITVQNAIDMFYAENQQHPEAESIEELGAKLTDYIENIPEDVIEAYTYSTSEGLQSKKKSGSGG